MVLGFLHFLLFLLFSKPITAVGGNFYSERDSPVLELNPKSFQKEIINSNSVSIVEFYAPWCGHCQNLKPEFVKAAKSLKGLATVGAINCDEQINKQLCSQYNIQGFPTLKVFRPHKVDLSENNKRDLKDKKNIKSKPAVENYNGERTSKSIVNFILSRLRNYVTAIKPANIDKFLHKNTDKPKVVVLATTKSKHSGSIPPLLKSISSDFVYKYSFGYIDYKQPESLWEKFSIKKEDLAVDETSKLIIIPPSSANDKQPIIYEGKLNKSSISDFLKNYHTQLKKSQRKKTTPLSEQEKLDL